ncbi:MAG: hypothetical protein NVV72_00985 [Asticcacaulis sp.]|nr:hypothetical protein [Asticcacaulis sp.]
MSCLPQRLNRNEHFADMPAVTKRIAGVGLDTLGGNVQCDGKRGSLVTVIRKGQDDGKGGE